MLCMRRFVMIFLAFTTSCLPCLLITSIFRLIISQNHVWFPMLMWWKSGRFTSLPIVYLSLHLILLCNIPSVFVYEYDATDRNATAAKISIIRADANMKTRVWSLWDSWERVFTYHLYNFNLLHSSQVVIAMSVFTFN